MQIKQFASSEHESACLHVCNQHGSQSPKQRMQMQAKVVNKNKIIQLVTRATNRSFRPLFLNPGTEQKDCIVLRDKYIFPMEFLFIFLLYR